eukprot:3460572-Pyramimonas_sp.AAC.1
MRNYTYYGVTVGDSSDHAMAGPPQLRRWHWLGAPRSLQRWLQHCSDLECVGQLHRNQIKLLFHSRCFLQGGGGQCSRHGSAAAGVIPEGRCNVQRPPSGEQDGSPRRGYSRRCGP